MIVIPAVDVRAGRCVRLLQGDYARETVYADDPVEQALEFAACGASRIHLVDLDAARGHADERSSEAVRAVVAALAATNTTVQVAGGVRDEATASTWLDAGAHAVVIASLAVTRPAAAEALCRALPGRALLSLDVRDGRARAQGWTEDAGDAAEHLERWRGWPAAGVIHTDVGRDGSLRGTSVARLRRCVAAYDGPVFAAGGVSSLDDLTACATAGVAGVIVGRALYEGTLTLREALRLFGSGAAS